MVASYFYGSLLSRAEYRKNRMVALSMSGMPILVKFIKKKEKKKIAIIWSHSLLSFFWTS